MDEQLEELRAQKEQLMIELHVEPILVSQAIKDLMKFMDEQRETDHAIIGWANKKENPYEEKGGCVVM